MRFGIWTLPFLFAAACSSSPSPELSAGGASVGGDIEPPGFSHVDGKADVACVDASCPNGESRGDQLLAPVAHYLNRGAEGRLAASFHPDDLLSVPPSMARSAAQLRLMTVGYLSLLSEAAQAQGHTLRVNSGFRSFCTQCNLFWGYVGSRENPTKPKHADNFSARAGHSEHQLGTAVDLHGNSASAFLGGPYDIPDTAIAQPAVYAWLDKHAWEYGFVNSYPPQDDAADHANFPHSTRTYRYTRYKVEPWHWRFVGKHAARVHRELYLATGIRVSTHELVELLLGTHLANFDDHALLMDALEDALGGQTLADLESPHPDDVAARSRALQPRCQSLGWISSCSGNELVACDSDQDYADIVSCQQGCVANSQGKHDRCGEWETECAAAGQSSQCLDATWLLRCDIQNQGSVAQKLPCQGGCSDGSCGDEPTPPPPPPPPPEDPCVHANGGDGPYCGQGIGGAVDTLYVCQGQKTASSTPCPAGCLQMPPGQADECQ